MPAWFRTTECDDVAGSLRHVLRCLPDTTDDPQAWKWVILGLHSALSGACICHLSGTAGVEALRKPSRTQWLEFLDQSPPEFYNDSPLQAPATYLMDMPELLRAIRKPNSAGDGSCNSGVLITSGELERLDRFHKELRNPLVHFEPIGLSIAVSGILSDARLIARVIRDILEAGWAFRQQDEGFIAETRHLLDKLSSVLPADCQE